MSFPHTRVVGKKSDLYSELMHLRRDRAAIVTLRTYKALLTCLASYGKIGPSHEAWKSRGNVNRHVEEEPGTTRETRTHRHH